MRPRVACFIASPVLPSLFVCTLFSSAQRGPLTFPALVVSGVGVGLHLLLSCLLPQVWVRLLCLQMPRGPALRWDAGLVAVRC